MKKPYPLGGDKALEKWLTTAKHLEKHGADATSEDYGQEHMPCFFDVLQAGDRLLQETRDRMQPSDADWNEFFDLVHGLIWNPMLLVFAQYVREDPAPVGAPATTVCKRALRFIYDTFDAKSEAGRTLRKPKLKALWQDLVQY